MHYANRPEAALAQNYCALPSYLRTPSAAAVISPRFLSVNTPSAVAVLLHLMQPPLYTNYSEPNQDFSLQTMYKCWRTCLDVANVEFHVLMRIYFIFQI
jgi:hypothetical protein